MQIAAISATRRGEGYYSLMTNILYYSGEDCKGSEMELFLVGHIILSLHDQINKVERKKIQLQATRKAMRILKSKGP